MSYPIIFDQLGKYPYITYAQVGYENNFHSMFNESYLVRFLGAPEYYRPGTQKVYVQDEGVETTINSSNIKERSRQGQKTLSAHSALDSKARIRGSIKTNLHLWKEVSKAKREAYYYRMMNNTAFLKDGGAPLSIEEEIYLGIRHATAVAIDKFLLQTLSSSIPEQSLQNGNLAGDIQGEYLMLNPADAVQKALPLTQYIAVNETYMENETTYGNAASARAQGLTLAKLMAASAAFRNNNIEGDLVCFIPQSLKDNLMSHPHASDRMKEYIGDEEFYTGSDGNKYKQPFSWMSKNMLRLDNIMLVFIPDNRFPKTAGQKRRA